MSEEQKPSEEQQSSNDPVIECKKNGPLQLNDLNTIIDTDGISLTPRKERVLCRCGKSGLKPYCDGEHISAEFETPEQELEEIEETEEYLGLELTIYYNPTVCYSSENCIRSLPAVFRMNTGDGIDPDGEEAHKIIETINACPSGALSFKYKVPQQNETEQGTEFKILKNGPYIIKGNVTIRHSENEARVELKRCSLCRCGFSENKPFCDGSHTRKGFRDDNFVRIAVVDDLREGLNKAVVDDKEVVIIKQGDTIAAFSNICLHAEASLAEGYIEGNHLTCGKHQWKYDLTTGELDGDPETHLKKLDTTIENQDLLAPIDQIKELPVADKD